MKKIIFTLLALLGTMSMNAQVMKIMKNGEDAPIQTYKGSDYYVVFEEAPAVTTTGTAKATINGVETDVNWVQLWENGPKFAEYNVGVTDGKAESYGGYYTWAENIASTKWGSAWRMPTLAELQELIANCDVDWTTINGVNGRKFKGKGVYSSDSVFLPAAGCCNFGDVCVQGNDGDYWSSTPLGSRNAYGLSFSSGYQNVGYYGRYGGYSVRAVLAE